ncbi:MAG: O-antigen ligase family protein, partial [Nitrospiraceae bacterium]
MVPPLSEGGTTHLAAMLIRLMLLSLTSLYLADGIRSGGLVFPVLRGGPIVAAFLGLAAVSTAVSSYVNQSMQWLVVLIGYAVLLHMLVCALTTWRSVAILLSVLVGMGLFEASWALAEGWWFGEPRPDGTFFNPNFLAGYLSAIWTVVFGCLCYDRQGFNRQRLGNRLVAQTATVVILALLLLAIVWTGSRGGMLALVTGALLVAGMRFGRKGAVVLMAAVLVSLLTPNPLRERLVAQYTEYATGSSISYARWQMWESAAREMGDHPFGVGLGLYQYLYPRYAFPLEGDIVRYGKVAQTPHSEYLQMGVELGWGGLLLFIGGVAAVTREAGAMLAQRLRRWQRGLLVGISAGLTGILVHAAVDSNLHEPAIAILVTLCVGIILSARRLVARRPAPERTIPIARGGLWAVVAVALVGVSTLHVVRLGVAWMFHESGSQALAKRELVRAVADFQTAIRLDAGKTLYRSSIAAAYFQMFERTRDPMAAQAASEELRRAIALNPLDGRLQGLLGYVLASAARAPEPPTVPSGQRAAWISQAITAYERAADLEPFSVFHGLELGRLYLAVGDLEKAETWVRNSVALEPNFLPGREWLVRRAMASGHLDEAEREYREIVERRQRYAAVPKGDIEARFLAAD